MLSRSFETDLTAPPVRPGPGAWVSKWLLAGKLRQELALVLVNCYIFLLTLGILQRPFGNPFGFGLSSIVSILIVALLLPETLRMIRVNRPLQLWLSLITYVFVITEITHPVLPLSDPEYMRILGLLACYLLCAATACLPWTAASITTY